MVYYYQIVSIPFIQNGKISNCEPSTHNGLISVVISSALLLKNLQVLSTQPIANIPILYWMNSGNKDQVSCQESQKVQQLNT